ncbi:hypothetical protein SASPL_118246 [Salvia splendens]|uniref:Uncharacterized protein n=1 Tax=Salvia splendens TaxID=180675 RepID=A0A8X8XZD2_SALSN|nr:hypothetical protein SASPL_118246 [Salvia splendens]
MRPKLTRNSAVSSPYSFNSKRPTPALNSSSSNRNPNDRNHSVQAIQNGIRSRKFGGGAATDSREKREDDGAESQNRETATGNFRTNAENERAMVVKFQLGIYLEEEERKRGRDGLIFFPRRAEVSAGSRPRLNLQPRTLPVIESTAPEKPKAEIASPVAVTVRPAGNNPFGRRGQERRC